MFNRLFGLISPLLGGASLGDRVAIMQAVFGALSRLPAAEGSRDYHAIAIGILDQIAPITATEVDDGTLIALRALQHDQAWHDFVDEKLISRPDDIPEDALALPEGALALHYGLESGDDLPSWSQVEVQKLSLVGSSADLLKGVARVLPFVLELIRELRRIREQGSD